MKITKTQLKNLVKECLLEVLAEGLGSEAQVISETRAVAKKTKKRARAARPSALDKIKFDKNLDQKISSTVEGITKDPIMQSIFTDTAKTTLQEQLQHSSTVPVPPGADRATHAAAASNPTDLFEGSSNWAMLAFDETS